MKTLKLTGEVGKRSKNIITYHSRKGHPVIHSLQPISPSRPGRRYIMVRAPKGKGVKRLYEGSKYTEK